MNPGVEAARLSPRSINVCQGEKVVITCIETETDRRYLRWSIVFESTQVPTIELTLNRLFNESVSTVHELELFFHSNWTSFSPLYSMLTINTTSAALNGSEVTCATRSSVQPTDSLMITIRGKVTPLMINSFMITAVGMSLLP